MSFALTTTAFAPGGSIPARFTCDGADLSPDLAWSGAPAATRSLALIADDPDAPAGTWTHWLLWNIPTASSSLPAGVPKQASLSNGTAQGRSSFRRIGYGGPCPPPGKPHRYFFKLYALDTALNLQPGASRDELERALEGHVLAHAELMGLYGR
jgi:Raf kinase inhibitor-like YbhB/YbcL family protein